MVADSRAYSGEKTPIGSKRKAHKLADGTLIGITTSNPGYAEALVAWYDGDQELPAPPSPEHGFYMLLIKPDGRVFHGNDSHDLSGPLTAPYFAIGTGAQYAIGAFEMGADAHRACEIGTSIDIYSGFPLTVEKLDVA